MLPDQNPDGQPLADTQRLINTLEKCFSDLMRKQEEQSDKFHQALEALKPNPPATNTNTAFWNAYKALADEHDKEFQQKYSTDLDMALIFAGLFSAVDSAFIIQIQPEIQSHTEPLLVLVAQNLLYVSLFSTLLAALLAVLGKQWLMYYLGAGERGTIEARGLERQRKFDGLRRWKFDAVMQTFPLLLQIGLFLFTAALSIYLWTVHLSLAIIGLFFTSFGFISYTGLLISAVAAPDSPFQTPLAPLVMRLIPTTLLLKSRPLTSRIMTPVRGIIQRCHSVLRSICGAHNLLPFHESRTSEASINSKPSGPAVLFDVPVPDPSPAVPAVCWLLETSTDPRMIAIAAEMVIDLQWPCDDMDVRPLLNKLRDGILTCFRFSPDQSGGRFILNYIRDGMSTHAIYLGRAYCTLRSVLLLGGQRAEAREYWCFVTILPIKDPELENVLRILGGSLDLHFESHRATKWGLNVLPSHRYFDRETLASNRLALDGFLEQFSSPTPVLDKASFADYLFCLLVFLSCASSRGAVCMDKRCEKLHQYQTKVNRFSSPFQGKLFEHLFHALESNIATRQISMVTAAKILDITGQVTVEAERSVWNYEFHHLRQFLPYRFCSSLPQWDGWIGVVLATGRLTGKHDYGHRSPNRQQVPDPQDAGWVYTALESISEIACGQEGPWDSFTVDGVAGLLEALMFYCLPAAKEHIHILLRALSIRGHVSENAAALLVQDHVITWFQEENLQQILKAASVWSSLMRVALEVDKPDLTRNCIRMALTLAEIPHWKSDIHEDPCTLITIFFRMNFGGRNVAESYNPILSEICQTNPYNFVDSDERALGLSYQVLCDVWRDFDFTASGSMLKSIVPWLRCTNVVLMCTYFFVRDEGEFWSEDYVPITPEFKTAFSVPLRDALLEAATAVENMLAGSGVLDSRNGRQVAGKVTEILEDMASKTPKHTDPRPEKADKMHWESVQKQLDEEIDRLEAMLETLTTST